MACQCNIPDGGWCEPHQCWKSTRWVQLCQTRPEYVALWEAGKGPGQHPVEPPGLGDMVEGVLSAIGITEDRYRAVKAALGLKRKCNCGKRKKALNRLGRKIGIG